MEHPHHHHEHEACRSCGKVHGPSASAACEHNETACATGSDGACCRHAHEEEGEDDSGGPSHHHHESDCCGGGGHEHGDRCCCGAVATYIRGDGKNGKKSVFTPHNILLAVGLLLFLVTNIFFRTGNKWVYLGLSIGAYLLIGYKVLWRCCRNVARGRVFDENFLMTLATVGAFLLFECFEAVAVMIFYEIGERFQDYAVAKSVGRVKDMLDILPDSANLVRGGETVSVRPANLEVGDIILVRVGERVPVDAVLVEGASCFDTSSLTGESVPREYAEGNEVLSGSFNTQSVVKARVIRRLERSTATRILDMVENATEKKAKSEQFITKFARVYTPIVTFAALFVAFLLPLLTGAPYNAYYRAALVFLIVSCPCALVISIPLSYFAAIGSSAKIGALFKGSNYLATLQQVDTVIFDKTGTLTHGSFDVRDIVSLGSLTEEEVLEAVAYGESQSNHPIARSVLKRFGKDIDLSRVSGYEEVAGGGVRCAFDGRPLLIGKAGFLAGSGIALTAADTPYTAVYLAVDGKAEGYLTLADRVKEDSAEALAQLRALGVKRLVMLTGDNRAVAEAVAGQLGVDTVYSEMLPQEKLEVVDRIVTENRKKTAYVGDGINDVLALSRADVGISTGSTADAAMESADVVVPKSSVMPIAGAKRLACRTRRVVIENIAFSLAVKVVVMALSFVVSLPLFAAILADVGCALVTVLNALRLLRGRKPGGAPERAALAVE